MCTYIYVLNIPVFCAIWLKKCDFLTEKLGIKSDPDPKLFIPDPDPSKIPDPAGSGSGSTTLVCGGYLDIRIPIWLI
jgi:hypothetical protein